MQSIGSVRGASGHGQNPFAALISPNADENNGEAYAMNFVYSGNFKASVEVDMHLNTRFQMGLMKSFKLLKLCLYIQTKV